MTINYHKLKLPKNPLKNRNCFDNLSDGPWTIFTDPVSLLTEETLLALKQVDLEPDLAVLFVCHYSERTNGYIHIDLTLKDDKWAKIPFAINWELNENFTTEVFWYDVTDCFEIWPPITTDPKLCFLNGAFYKKNPKLQETVTLTSDDNYLPILFRTDVAHSTTFKTTEKSRYCLSLRFNLDKIPDWESAQQLVSSIIV
jgi:hypothetical protein